MPGRRAGPFLLCHLALAVTVTGVAWACIPQPMLLVEPRASATAGAAVTVRGLNFTRRAEIRFNGVSGPLLETADGEQFRAKVRVPRAPAGLYTLVALTRDQSGSVSGMASAPLEIAAGPPGLSPGAARPRRTRDASSGKLGPALAAAGGFGLLLLGGLTGALLARRRPRRRG